jgi:hypothetical protein
MMPKQNGLKRNEIDILDEGRLLAADPLLLFGGGLPPRELIVAQVKRRRRSPCTWRTPAWLRRSNTSYIAGASKK